MITKSSLVIDKKLRTFLESESCELNHRDMVYLLIRAHGAIVKYLVAEACEGGQSLADGLPMTETSGLTLQDYIEDIDRVHSFITWFNPPHGGLPALHVRLFSQAKSTPLREFMTLASEELMLSSLDPYDRVA